MSNKQQPKANTKPEPTTHEMLAARHQKLDRLRDTFQLDPYGQRCEGIMSCHQACEIYDADADKAYKGSQAAAKEAGEDASAIEDTRTRAKVAGRVVQHRVMGNLIFAVIRDDSGDLQIALSKKSLAGDGFKIAKSLDYGDVIACEGPLAVTKTGELTLWAQGEQGLVFLTKSLSLPPGKWEGHGLQDKEQRYRKRYVDLYANPEVMQVMRQRSKLVKATRDFFENRDFLEVETPMMQPIAGGAAARPFTTHHNALDMELFMRIAPELYLKRLLVGGMRKVFEINRNFRNEGISPRHNPEFTMLELYEAYGDLYSVMDHTEQLFQHLASTVCGDSTQPFGEWEIDYSNFRRAKYLDLFEEHNGFPTSDEEKVRSKARELGLKEAGKELVLVANEVWEETVEEHLIQPTFVIDYPAQLCPLTKRKPGEEHIAERFELFIARMEIANAYTELNDPQVQENNFRQQMDGIDDEESQFRNVDEDFLEALRVGMPPAGGLGIGIDRMVMLLTNQCSIRDVILFPLMRHER